MNTTMNRTDTNYRRTLGATTLVGDNVDNAKGENLGTLKEIMIDVERGRIAYGVLQTGDILGLGGKFLAVPFEAFKVDEKNEKLILNVDKETLKNAEGFDKNNWPDTTNPEWGRQTHQYYGLNPYWERS